MPRKQNKKITKKRGGCGCGGNSELQKIIVTGGNGNNTIVPLNNYNNDPSVVGISTRIMPNMMSPAVPFLSGGKIKKGKKTKKGKTKKGKTEKSKKIKRRYTMRKHKGGSDQALSSINSNAVTSFNTVMGVPTSVNIITGENDGTMNIQDKMHSQMNPQMPFI